MSIKYLFFYLKLTDSKDDDWNNKFKRTYLEKMITVLFKACANCQYPEFAIKKCDSLRVYLKNRDIKPDVKTYCAMINAYGRSGAVYEAFNVADEMILLGKRPSIDVFKNLMTACISNREYGFKYSLNVCLVSIFISHLGFIYDFFI